MFQVSGDEPVTQKDTGTIPGSRGLQDRSALLEHRAWALRVPCKYVPVFSFQSLGSVFFKKFFDSLPKDLNHRAMHRQIGLLGPMKFAQL